MKTGWISVGGKEYYLNTVSDGTRGALLVNCITPDGRRVGSGRSAHPLTDSPDKRRLSGRRRRLPGAFIQNTRSPAAISAAGRAGICLAICPLYALSM